MTWMQTVLIVQCSALVLMVICGLSQRFDWLPFKPMFLLFLVLALMMTIGAFIGLIMMFKSFKVIHVLQLVLGVLPLLAFFSLVGSGGLNVPKIHDIATRHEPPILFELAQMERKPGENSLNAPSKEVVDMQTSYYSNLRAVELNLSIEGCFHAVEKLVESSGWQLIGVDSNKRWLEAYERSLLLGFKDDIRVEISPIDENTCRVDARSVSRVGLSDLGANARRIQSFLAQLTQR